MNKFIDKFKDGFDKDAKALASIINKEKHFKNYTDHLVLIIHGVNYFNKKHKQTARWISDHTSTCTARPVTYGITPFTTCIIPTHVEKKKKILLSRIKEDIEEANKNNFEVSFICHSCGTHILTEIIDELDISNLKNVIFCGGVVNRDYDFKRFYEKHPDVKIINECGVKDFIPTLAATITNKNGLSSTGSARGFSLPSIKIYDRVHNFGHSGYFNEEFVKNYWVPILENNDDTKQGISNWSSLHDHTNSLIEKVNLNKNWKFIFPVIFVLLLVLFKIILNRFSWNT